MGLVAPNGALDPRGEVRCRERWKAEGLAAPEPKETWAPATADASPPSTPLPTNHRTGPSVPTIRMVMEEATRSVGDQRLRGGLPTDNVNMQECLMMIFL